MDEVVSIDMGGRLAVRLAVVGAVALVLGVALLAGVVGGAVTNEGGGAVIAALVGSFVVLFGGLCLYGTYRGRGVRLVIDRDGIARQAPRGGWRIAWAQLDRVGVSVVRWELPRATNSIGAGERMGRIVLAPNGDLGPLYGLRTGDEPEPWTHRVTLGAQTDWIDAADAGLRRFAGERYVPLAERPVLRRRYS
ncbi:hypothetical protein ACVU7I_07715 [Patulibacter sp. S7RM1-6]